MKELLWLIFLLSFNFLLICFIIPIARGFVDGRFKWNNNGPGTQLHRFHGDSKIE